MKHENRSHYPSMTGNAANKGYFQGYLVGSRCVMGRRSSSASMQIQYEPHITCRQRCVTCCRQTAVLPAPAAACSCVSSLQTLT